MRLETPCLALGFLAEHLAAGFDIVSVLSKGYVFSRRFDNHVEKHVMQCLLAVGPTASEDDLDDRLLHIARRLKLRVFDLDEGIYGFDSSDTKYGLEVVQTQVRVDGGLGLVLTELASASNGRGLVLISDVSGNSAQATSPIQVGDVITGVRTTNGRFQARTAGSNYDETMETIVQAKQAAEDGILRLELNRLVERAKIEVQIMDEKGDIAVVDALAGENLRSLILRKGIALYDRRTKRFDMPFATGDCAGEGLCGTCLVAVKEGMDCLNPKDELETLITKGRPLAWRASCRTVVGANNQPGQLKITVKPQSKYSSELNPGVKSV